MKRLLVLVVAVAAAVALAGVFLPSSAATVGSTTISRQSLDSDLTAIAGSPDYGCFLSEERLLAGGREIPVVGAGSSATNGGIYDTAFVDDWLDSMITNRVAARLLASRGVTLSTEDVAQGKAILTRRITSVLREYATDAGSSVPACGGSGSAVLASMPGWFVTQAARGEADQAVLDARAVGSGLGTAQIGSYFAAHRATFDKVCLSIIVVKTKAAADKAAAAISGGTSFSQEASTVSLTTGTGANGGTAGCGFISGTFLATHLASLPVKAVSKPFSARGVWWLATVTRRSTVPLSSVRSDVVTTIVQAGQSRAASELRSALHRSHITVDARYGTATRGPTLIAPPAVPPSSALLSASANKPTLTTPAAG